MSDSAWKNIVVFLNDTLECSRLGKIAAELAQANLAHLVGIYGMTHAEAERPQDAFARGAAIRDSLEHHRQADQQKVLNAGKHLALLSEQYVISSEFRVIWSERAKEEIFLQSLHCDLIVAGHPEIHGFPPNWSTKLIFLTGGTPVLRIPEGWQGDCPGKKIVVAWNASREARRAITDAMPIIRTAEEVTLLVIDPERSGARYGEEPGADIARHLARHGANVEVARIPSERRPVAEVLLSEASHRQADLLVLGAYSHPHATEVVFGGVTRDLLAHTSIPLFMSR